MDYYKRYMGDYGRDTSRLSMMEHGAYNLLLDDYYSTRTPLPADIEQLYRICRATIAAEQKAVAAVASQFFPVCQDGLRHNHRADEEIAKWEEFAEQNREKGKLGGRPKKNPSGNPMGNPTGSSGGNPNGTQRETQRGTHGFEKPPLLETRDITRNVTRTETPPNPIPNPIPNPKPNHTQEGCAGGVEREGKTAGPEDAWRDVTECDPVAYESWLRYRDEAGDPVPARVRLEHAKFLGGKGDAEKQRAFVANLIQLQFKRLRDPSHDVLAANGKGHGRKTYDDYARESEARLAALPGDDPGPM